MQNARLTNRDDGNMVSGVRLAVRSASEVVVAFPLVGHLVDETYSAEGAVFLTGTGYQPVNNAPLWRRRWRVSIELSDPNVAEFLKRLELFAVTEIVRLFPNAEFVKAQLHANGGNVNTLYQFLREQRDHMPLTCASLLVAVGSCLSSTRRCRRQRRRTACKWRQRAWARV